MKPLSSDQKSFFSENGYLMLERAFDGAAVRAMQNEADHLMEVVLNSSLAHNRLSGRLDWLINEQGQQVVRKIQPINDMSLLFTNVSASDTIMNPLREIMGEEPILMEEKLNYKQPLPTPVVGLPVQPRSDRFPLHSDWAYYQVQKYPQNILSSALLLDDCNPDNGPLRIWPGSHREHLEHELVTHPDGHRERQVKAGLIDPEGGIDVIAPAGSFVLFHALLIHNSRSNLSGRPRRLMIYSHYPASFPVAPDVRNGPTRLRESPWEREYMRMKLSGKYADTFRAPKAASA